LVVGSSFCQQQLFFKVQVHFTRLETKLALKKNATCEHDIFTNTVLVGYHVALVVSWNLWVTNLWEHYTCKSPTWYWIDEGNINLGWLGSFASKSWSKYCYISCLGYWFNYTSRVSRSLYVSNFGVLQNWQLENWRRNKFSIHSSLVVASYVKAFVPLFGQFVKGDFSKQNAMKSHLRASWSWTLWMLWCEYHYTWWRRIWIGGQCLSYDTTWENGEFLVWTKYCKKFKLLYIYFWKNMIWSSILCERLRFSQPIHDLIGSFWWCLSH